MPRKNKRRLFHLDGLRRAGIDARGAIRALLRIDYRLLILDLDRARGARLDAITTSFALLELDNRSHEKISPHDALAPDAEKYPATTPRHVSTQYLL